MYLIEPGPIHLALIGAILTLATVIEFRTGRIPNWLTLSAVAAGLDLAVADQNWPGHLAGLVVAFLVGFAAFGTGYAGGGMVKLMIGLSMIGGCLLSLVAVGISCLVVIYYTHINPAGETTAPEDEQPQPLITRGSVIASFTTVVLLAVQHQLAP